MDLLCPAQRKFSVLPGNPVQFALLIGIEKVLHSVKNDPFSAEPCHTESAWQLVLRTAHGHQLYSMPFLFQSSTRAPHDVIPHMT